MIKNDRPKIVVVSDTHELHSAVYIPDGDVFIHCGDASFFGAELEDEDQFKEFNEFAGQLPHEHKLFVPGNHDFFSMKGLQRIKKILTNFDTLIDSEIWIDEYSFFGSAIDYKTIISSVDVLISHEAPYGILDGGFGSKALLKSIHTFQPKYHLFGHAHSQYGICQNGKTIHVNASICDEKYKPKNGAVVIYL
jgi:Icc-related predicted phosphoesterase